MQHIVDRNQEVLNNFIKAIEELAILRDNLLKKEVRHMLHVRSSVPMRSNQISLFQVVFKTNSYLSREKCVGFWNWYIRIYCVHLIVSAWVV